MDKVNWYELTDSKKISSPALLVYPDRIERNIQKMVAIAGDVSRLRPHIKTHKTREIVMLQMHYGITKFKCATIAEAELLGQCGAKDVLLAMQPVGHTIDRFFSLVKSFPNTKFSTLVDNIGTLRELNGKAKECRTKIGLWLDLNTGMDRTGIKPGAEAEALYALMATQSNVTPMGLHIYDGHIRNSDFGARKKVCDAAFEPVLELKQQLESQGIEVNTIIAGGSPTFPVHALRNDVELGPGTTLLWDARYGPLFSDMRFEVAAVLLTRIISKPAPGLLCFDLGHKSIAPEMEFPRVYIFGLEDSPQISQSEEHLVVACKTADLYEVGDTFYAIPMHICPTVAKYEELLTVVDGTVTGTWKVAARNQKITL
jgi:D-serine deaminase-like pyridoxal phosphate-dependent protein